MTKLDFVFYEKVAVWQLTVKYWILEHQAGEFFWQFHTSSVNKWHHDIQYLHNIIKYTNVHCDGLPLSGKSLNIMSLFMSQLLLHNNTIMQLMRINGWLKGRKTLFEFVKFVVFFFEAFRDNLKFLQECDDTQVLRFWYRVISVFSACHDQSISANCSI